MYKNLDYAKEGMGTANVTSPKKPPTPNPRGVDATRKNFNMIGCMFISSLWSTSSN
jgi:hypothetical protein